MISDVLSDAVHLIARYQRKFSDCYSGLRPQIDMVRRTMDELRRHLDTPPVEPFHTRSLARLNAALGLSRGSRRHQPRRSSRTRRPVVQSVLGPKRKRIVTGSEVNRR